jgi:hypothetical protein
MKDQLRDCSLNKPSLICRSHILANATGSPFYQFDEFCPATQRLLCHLEKLTDLREKGAFLSYSFKTFQTISKVGLAGCKKVWWGAVSCIVVLLAIADCITFGKG